MRVFPGGDGNFETGMKKVRAAIARGPLVAVHLRVATVHTIRSRIKGLTGKEKTELVSRRFEVAREARAQSVALRQALRTGPEGRTRSWSPPARPPVEEAEPAFTINSMNRTQTTWLQQLLGDVDITIGGLDKNMTAYPAWTPGAPSWISDPVLAANQPGFYETELRVQTSS